MKQEVSGLPLKHPADKLWVELHRAEAQMMGHLHFSNLFLSGVVILFGHWVTQSGKNDKNEGSTGLLRLHGHPPET